jgi:predicted Na+-dependent transporter
MNFLLPVVIFVSWFAFLLIPAGKLAVEDARNNVPKDKRRGTSVLPGFPVFPLIAWGIAVAVDHFIAPWGSWTILGIHGALLLISVSLITRDFLHLRRLKA